MSKATDSYIPPEQRVDDIAAILEAMRRGVREALARHKQAGNPVAVWREGRVVLIPPEEIPMGDEAE